MRVAIVNDVPIIVEALRRIVLSNPLHQVAWTAVDGEEAVRKAAQDRPDAILMDLLMPIMNGADATREIMRQSPCPILVVTQTVVGNYRLVCQAINAGAFDAVDTPMLGQKPPAEAGAQVLRKLTAVEKINQQLSGSGSWAQAAQFQRVSLGSGADVPPGSTRVGPPVPLSPASTHTTQVFPSPFIPLIAIGASTGGPPALDAILSALPADFPGAIVVTQHIDRDFTPALVQWLSERSKLKVVAAANGDRPARGTVLVAATNDHLVLTTDRTLKYTREPVDCPYRPSVDALFESLSLYWGRPGAAVLLTGIGRDGADGLLKLRHQNWLTIAQDQSTSVVYGMPKSAAQIGAAQRILPVQDIAAKLLEFARK